MKSCRVQFVIRNRDTKDKTLQINSVKCKIYNPRRITEKESQSRLFFCLHSPQCKWLAERSTAPLSERIVIVVCGGLGDVDLEGVEGEGHAGGEVDGGFGAHVVAHVSEVGTAWCDALDYSQCFVECEV